ncbi:MAG: hypothetical protein J7M26_09690 [Armatimonadetes bacterium]|nr:hypothetical protein [Armatimonadota bacterium]
MSEPVSGETRDEKLAWLAALLSAVFPGIGQIYNDQTNKGVLLIILAIFGSAMTCGVGYLPVWVIAVVDAALVADKLNKGREVGDWDFF